MNINYYMNHCIDNYINSYIDDNNIKIIICHTYKSISNFRSRAHHYAFNVVLRRLPIFYGLLYSNNRIITRISSTISCDFILLPAKSTFSLTRAIKLRRNLHFH